MPGEYDYDSEEKVVKCPRHGWEYDLATGQSWYLPERKNVRSYELSLEAASEVAKIGIPAVRLPGPFSAEVIPISVDGDYVVVDV
jgi:nitrite reductase/ring-hydroxylating ferredoxin subunit